MANKKNQFGKFMSDYGMLSADATLGLATTAFTGKDISDLTGYENQTNSDFINFGNTMTNVVGAGTKAALPMALTAVGVPAPVTMAAQQLGTGLAGNVEQTNTGWLPKMKLGGSINKSTIEVEGNELEVTPDGKVVNDFSKMQKHKDGGVVYGATTGNHIISSKNKDKFSQGDSISKSSIMLSQSRNQAQGDALMDKFANGGKITPFVKWATKNGMTKSEAIKYAKGGEVKPSKGLKAPAEFNKGKSHIYNQGPNIIGGPGNTVIGYGMKGEPISTNGGFLNIIDDITDVGQAAYNYFKNLPGEGMGSAGGYAKGGIVKYEEGAPVKKQSMLTAEEVAGNENMFTNPNDIGYSKFNNFMEYGLNNKSLNYSPNYLNDTAKQVVQQEIDSRIANTPVPNTDFTPFGTSTFQGYNPAATYNAANPGVQTGAVDNAVTPTVDNVFKPQGTSNSNKGFDYNSIVPYLGSAFQLGQTFTKKQYIPRAENPYAKKAMNMMANRTFDINPALADVKEASRVGNYNNRQIANNTGAYLAGNTANVNARNKATSALWAQKANMDNQYRGEEAQFMGNLGAQEAQYENAYQTGKVMTDANARNVRSQAGMDMSNIYMNQQREKNLATMQDKTVSMFPQLFKAIAKDPVAMEEFNKWYSTYKG